MGLKAIYRLVYAATMCVCVCDFYAFCLSLRLLSSSCSLHATNIFLPLGDDFSIQPTANNII
jgi:hypothetical protein